MGGWYIFLLLILKYHNNILFNLLYHTPIYGNIDICKKNKSIKNKKTITKNKKTGERLFFSVNNSEIKKNK